MMSSGRFLPQITSLGFKRIIFLGVLGWWLLILECCGAAKSASARITTRRAPWRDTHPRNAEYYSDMHNSVRVSEARGNNHRHTSTLITVAPMLKRVAVILTGPLRVQSESHFQSLVSALGGSDSFVVTYPFYGDLARRLVATPRRVLVVDASQEPSPPPVSSMWQWLLLNKGLLHWRNVFLHPGGYDTLVRFRTDFAFPPTFRFSQCEGRETPEGGIVYAHSDAFFYSTPSVMFRTFVTMYNASVSVYQHREVSPSRREAFKQVVLAYGGLKPSCLVAEKFAPERSWLERLAAGAQPTVVFKKKDDHRRLLQGTNNSPKSKGAVHTELRHTKKIPDFMERRFCGCKFGLGQPGGVGKAEDLSGWTRPGSRKKAFQSEPAFAYHILMANSSCLPLDLKNRESFHVMRTSRNTVAARANFHFGVNLTTSEDGEHPGTPSDDGDEYGE